MGATLRFISIAPSSKDMNTKQLCDQCGTKENVHYQGVCSNCHAKGYKRGDSYTPTWMKIVSGLLIAGFFIFLAFAFLMSTTGFYADTRIWAGLSMVCMILLGVSSYVKFKRPRNN